MKIYKNLIEKRLFVVLLFSVVLIVILCTHLLQSDSVNPDLDDNDDDGDSLCYLQKFSEGRTLPNVVENHKLRSHDSPRNIFFHETSCSRDGIIRLSNRQACAIESAAMLNPNHNIFVLFTSQVGFRNKSSIPIIDALASYPNVNFNFLNLTQYAEDTPLAEWMKTGELYESLYVNYHTADILRYLSLWKYSGTYLDLDIVMMKALDTSQPNFAGAESETDVAAGIINVENESGHEIADLFVKDLLQNFNGMDWGNNGPGVITRVLKKLCNTKDVLEMISSNSCKNFRVLPIEACYSIHWLEHGKFFEEKYLIETMERLKDSIIAHVWNKFSAATELSTNSNVAYIHLAKSFCPKVIKLSESF